jgi:hypothetical protein
MDSVETILAAIVRLPAEDFARIKEWFQGLENQSEQLPVDPESQVDRLNSLIEELAKDTGHGRTQRLSKIDITKFQLPRIS